MLISNNTSDRLDGRKTFLSLVIQVDVDGPSIVFHKTIYEWTVAMLSTKVIYWPMGDG